MSPDGEAEDAESPMPQINQAVRRRGAISAEPITEEDVATYVKKVKIWNFYFKLKWTQNVLQCINGRMDLKRSKLFDSIGIKN